MAFGAHYREAARLTERAVWGVLKRLPASGEVVAEKGGGKGRCNHYRIQLPNPEPRNTELGDAEYHSVNGKRETPTIGGAQPDPGRGEPDGRDDDNWTSNVRGLSSLRHHKLGRSGGRDRTYQQAPRLSPYERGSSGGTINNQSGGDPASATSQLTRLLSSGWSGFFGWWPVVFRGLLPLAMHIPLPRLRVRVRAQRRGGAS